MVPWLFSIHPGEDRPLFRQIVEQVKAAIASGRVVPGERLPTHRDLARDLVVAPLTVKKAYDVLEAEGFVRQVQGRGTFVAKGGSAREDAQDELSARAGALVRQARIMGLREEDLKKLLARAWRKGGSHVGPVRET